ncbi:MAG: serine--tRNA ligase [Candidatus Micrarchaeota archaeon]|nr:serine--tRNA ligase [Candidatus Micrarchaeota archaeon]MCX8154633.1 serine--tRNA ligase [Candidatus Micrarchaeota archaeon]
MIDIELIRKNIDIVKYNLKIRGYPIELADELYRIDSEWKSLKAELDNLRAEKNRLTQQIAKQRSSDAIQRVKEINLRIQTIENQESELDRKRRELWSIIPNILDSTVPIGKDDTDNVEIRRWGDRIKERSISHYDIPDFMFEHGAKISGHRFTVLRGKIARLERALINYMMDLAILNGYTEMSVPHLVRPEIMFGTGQLPKFEEELYRVERDNLYLIPTAEVPLTNLHRDEILDETDLPIYYSAFTPCYRREAGAYGKDIKGLIRQHQFYKVELVKITLPENSKVEHEKMLRDAESVLQGLELPYRVIVLCSGDTGFSSAKTYDIEVWMPSQSRYREISSVSNCTDFQSRRIPLRFRRGDSIEYPHTLNGSGVAVGRALIALIENHWEDRGIRIPKRLQGYVGTDYIEINL